MRSANPERASSERGDRGESEGCGAIGVPSRMPPLRDVIGRRPPPASDPNPLFPSVRGRSETAIPVATRPLKAKSV